MKNFINGKNIAIGIITLAIGIFVVVGIAKAFNYQTTTVNGNIAAFVLNPEGRVDGAILDTGDQIKFGAQTGELVTANVKIGGALSATGHAGSKSDYGREIHAETLEIGGQTITVVKPAPKPHEHGKDDKPRPPKGERPEPKGDRTTPQPDAPVNDAANQTAPMPPIAPMPKETVNASGKVRFVIVGGRGEVRGVILASGEQVDLPKEIKDAGLTIDQNTDVSVSGEAAKGNFGTFIRPVTLTVGSQTFSFNR